MRITTTILALLCLAAASFANDAVTYHNKGMESFEKKDYDQAISDFTQAIRLNPNSFKAYTMRGLAYQQKGDYDKAIAEYTQAIRLNPNFGAAYGSRGLVYALKGQYYKGIEDWKPALQNYDKADDDLRTALRIDPNDPNAKNILEAVETSSAMIRLVLSKGQSSNTNAQEKTASPPASGNTLTDSRDGKKYKTVKIGSQTWMAENLNYEVSGSKCYDNNSGNCAKYGRLYDWNTARSACPSGWHLPSKSEYEALDKAVGGKEVAGKKLKAKSGWNGNGTDEFGFSALPGGNELEGNLFYFVGRYCYLWINASDESNKGYAYYRHIYDDRDNANWSSTNKSVLFSVRCIKD
jgi:uncharacterized protein (TIGR02145 family)